MGSKPLGLCFRVDVFGIWAVMAEGFEGVGSQIPGYMRLEFMLPAGTEPEGSDCYVRCFCLRELWCPDILGIQSFAKSLCKSCEDYT